MARGWSLICDWTLRIFSHLFPSPERGVGLEMEFIIDGSSVRKPPQKSREYVVWRASGWANTATYWDGTPQLCGDRSTCARQAPLGPRPTYLFTWVFTESFLTSFNELVNANVSPNSGSCSKSEVNPRREAIS